MIVIVIKISDICECDFAFIKISACQTVVAFADVIVDTLLADVGTRDLAKISIGHDP